MRNRFSKVVFSLATLGLLATTIGACGGVQVPPAEGECREWREWVPPVENSDGTWTEGYCRDVQ